MSKIELSERPKILIVTLRRLGDVLLTTPLVRTLRRGLPDASLDMLVFAGSERILKGNPDVDHVLTMPERPSLADTMRLVRAYLASLRFGDLYPERRSADVHDLVGGAAPSWAGAADRRPVETLGARPSPSLPSRTTTG